ncbi:polysaccharide biosynthesis/export family protein [Allorhodopirellula heiligendammensis]|uniref:Polysaccharide biosynthesis/export protein n=1 Tax=Allorhodopirellula heiligendammensis TaxID=2714739 RepID=A0A5C6C895_9BACT|nr:polysaccharide biosynthesis/export family protein [Allorhodopirellula heiligendammensis]TWU18979.1 Polysaccharide biosynthesis/export protein [Allorhodopirellula heiligendammensis]
MIRTNQLQNITASIAATALITITTLSSTGCHIHSVASARNSIPANRLDPNLFGCSREALAPLPFSSLGQVKPEQHIIGPGDTLSIYVYGVFPANEEETPVQQRSQAINQRYYPPRGTVVGPLTGLPARVEGNGTIDMPLIGDVNITGLTMPQAVAKLKQAYLDENVLQEGKERVTVDLLIPRVRRIVVLRQDTPNPAVALTPPGVVDQVHRGSGEVIDLPIYENDVLHALGATGGLPGTDAARELYVIRNGAGINTQFLSGGSLQGLVSGGEAGQCNAGVIRIPLAGCPCDGIPFQPADVVLHEGDTVYIPRRDEYFITGGLLPGARIPLPRDKDVDVLEAIALATGSPGGPLGIGGQALIGGRPGYVREATQVMILRTLPDGRQINIRVDLDRAITDQKQRIRIMPDDVVMLHQKPGAAFFNTFLNYFSGDGILVSSIAD